jgi:hypothetical protein
VQDTCIRGFTALRANLVDVRRGPGRYPFTPPNYIGFGFSGGLQQVRHIESYKAMDAPWDEVIFGDRQDAWLGSRVRTTWTSPGRVQAPPELVLTRGLYGSGQARAAIDLLFTCPSARPATRRKPAWPPPAQTEHAPCLPLTRPPHAGFLGQLRGRSLARPLTMTTGLGAESRASWGWMMLTMPWPSANARVVCLLSYLSVQ